MRSLIISASLALTLTACGVPLENGPRRGEQAPPPDSRLPEGELSTAQIRAVMEQAQSGFNTCFKRSPGAFVAGSVLIKFTIARDGRVARAGVADSDLGSYKVEDCLVQAARFLEFPPPSGDGEARFAYPIMVNEAARRLSTPTEMAWGYSTLRQLEPAFEACRGRHNYREPFFITLYAGRMGSVLSVGFSADTLAPDDFATCIVQATEEATFPNPGAKTVKYRALVESVGAR